MNVAFIPVRCGSKSIPFKNIKDFCGKPLVYWNLLALQKSKNIDEGYNIVWIGIIPPRPRELAHKPFIVPIMGEVWIFFSVIL